MKIDKKKTINEESYGIITFKKLSWYEAEFHKT